MIMVHHSDMSPLYFVILALIIGAATRHFLRKSPIPYTVMLLLLGLRCRSCCKIGAFEGWGESFSTAVKWAGHIDPHLILYVFLPTLIFEAAFAMDIHTFKKSVGNAVILAVPGIIMALFLTAFVIIGIKELGIGLPDWTWQVALLFGVVISATDPVAVVALLKELGASKKLRNFN
jgi:NhaP-type Na+/H+ or K+/H+ antiporter